MLFVTDTLGLSQRTVGPGGRQKGVREVVGSHHLNPGPVWEQQNQRTHCTSLSY